MPKPDIQLSKDAKRILCSFPKNYEQKALEACAMGKAFCPSCHSVGMSNCGYFDKCGAFIMPSGKASDEK